MVLVIFFGWLMKLDFKIEFICWWWFFILELFLLWNFVFFIKLLLIIFGCIELILIFFDCNFKCKVLVNLVIVYLLV